MAPFSSLLYGVISLPASFSFFPFSHTCTHTGPCNNP
jgi:hypothetical protein